MSASVASQAISRLINTKDSTFPSSLIAEISGESSSSDYLTVATTTTAVMLNWHQQHQQRVRTEAVNDLLAICQRDVCVRVSIQQASAVN